MFLLADGAICFIVMLGGVLESEDGLSGCDDNFWLFCDYEGGIDVSIDFESSRFER